MRSWNHSRARSARDRSRWRPVGWALERFLRRYAEAQAEAVAPFVVGGRILDLGAGEGYVAAALRRRSQAWICSVDVGPFRRAGGPYVTYDGGRLPFGDLVFDTTLLLLALHHCAEPEAVLREALRVTRRRLIVMESVYRTRWEGFWLHFLDRWLNAHRHGGGMAVPFAFLSPPHWRGSFGSLGVRLINERWLGSWWERLVHHPLMFVLDRAAPPTGHRGSGSACQGTFSWLRRTIEARELRPGVPGAGGVGEDAALLEHAGGSGPPGYTGPDPLRRAAPLPTPDREDGRWPFPWVSD
jgi:SAM-dependent methyltransferase